MSINSKLTFGQSSAEAPDSAVKVPSKNTVNFFETLCKYCADNGIDTNSISEFDFSEAVETLEDYDHNSNYDFYFWVAN